MHTVTAFLYCGLGGRPFDLIKSRTMRPGPGASEWAADTYQRTTRVGRFLRRFRIDEAAMKMAA